MKKILRIARLVIAFVVVCLVFPFCIIEMLAKCFFAVVRKIAKELFPLCPEIEELLKELD